MPVVLNKSLKQIFVWIFTAVILAIIRKGELSVRLLKMTDKCETSIYKTLAS